MSEMNEMIDGLLVLPGEDPAPVRFENTVKGIQSLIGGHFQALPYRLSEEVWLLCDEEGKLKGLKPNFMIRSDIIVGPALFVGTNALGDDFDDLNFFDRDLIIGSMSIFRTKMSDWLEAFK